VNFKNKEWIMPGPKPPEIKLTEAEKEGLEKLVARRMAEHQKVLRGRIVLLAATGKNTPEIAKALDISLDMTRLWRRRWLELQGIGLDELSIEERLEDLPRPGAPAEITADQICQIEKMACEKPEKSGRPISQWTGREIADEIVLRGILKSISPRHAARLLKKGVSSHI
jgi:putative transposase